MEICNGTYSDSFLYGKKDIPVTVLHGWTVTCFQQKWARCQYTPGSFFCAIRPASGCCACTNRSTLRWGRCWMRGLRSAAVVAGQAVYVPLRSLLDACHWHAATRALSNTGTQQHLQGNDRSEAKTGKAAGWPEYRSNRIGEDPFPILSNLGKCRRYYLWLPVIDFDKIFPP